MVFRLDPQNLESGRLQCRSIPSSRLLQCWQDEEARPAEEEDEEVWEDGDSGHQRLGKAQIQDRKTHLNLSHLCQKLWCLSSQTQGALAPPACTGGPLVLPVVWDESPSCPQRGLPWSLQCPAAETERALSKGAFGTLSGMWQQPQEQAGDAGIASGHMC
ncbi:uncharacterized protein ACIQIH_005532 isoform 1-T3 [Cyanocitta cristata]